MTSIIYPSLTGAVSSFAIPFGYLSQEHVKVTLDGVLTTSFTFTSEFLIEMDVAPTGDLRVFRQTPSDASLVTWEDGAILVDDDLNLGNLQTLYVAEELEDSSFTTNDAGHFDAGGLKIQNLGTPTDSGDAVPFSFFETTYKTVLDAILAATELARDVTLGYRDETEAFRDEASSDRDAADLSAANALVSEGKALTSETNAAQSAVEAAQSAVDSANNATGLVPSNNLSDVASASTSRNNLGLNNVTSDKQLPIDGSAPMEGDLDMDDNSIIDAVMKVGTDTLLRIYRMTRLEDLTVYSTGTTEVDGATITVTPTNANTKLKVEYSGTLEAGRSGSGGAGADYGASGFLTAYDGVSTYTTKSTSKQTLQTNVTTSSSSIKRENVTALAILDQTDLNASGDWEIIFRFSATYSGVTADNYDGEFIITEME